MVRQVKVLATKPGNLSSASPRTHVVEGHSRLLQGVL